MELGGRGLRDPRCMDFVLSRSVFSPGSLHLLAMAVMAVWALSAYLVPVDIIAMSSA